MAESYSYAITSIAKPENFNLMKNDVDLAISEYLQFKFKSYEMDAQKKQDLLKEILDFTHSVNYRITSIANIEFM